MRHVWAVLVCLVLAGGCLADNPPAGAIPFLTYTQRTPAGGWRLVAYYPDRDRSVTVATSPPGQGPVVARLVPFGRGTYNSMDIYRPGTPSGAPVAASKVPHVVYLDRQCGQRLYPAPALQLDSNPRRILLDLVGDRALVAVCSDKPADWHQDQEGDLLLYHGNRVENLGRACVDAGRTAVSTWWIWLSPDRERVLWLRPLNEGEKADSKYDVWVANLNTGQSRRVESDSGQLLQWLPDGKTVLYVPKHSPVVLAMNADTGQQVAAPPAGRIAASPDGYFWAMAKQGGDLWRDPPEIVPAPGRKSGAGGDYVATPWAGRGGEVWYLPRPDPAGKPKLVVVTPQGHTDLPLGYRTGDYAFLSTEWGGRLAVEQIVDFPNPKGAPPFFYYMELVLKDFAGRTIAERRVRRLGAWGMLKPYDGGIVFLPDRGVERPDAKTEIRRMDLRTGRSEVLSVFDRPVYVQRLGAAYLATAEYPPTKGPGLTHEKWYVSRDGARTWRLMAEGNGLDIVPVNGEMPREGTW